jgi:hypothetical protein
MAAMLLAVVLATPHHADAQSGAGCPIASGSPVQKTANYTLSPNDICTQFYFTSTGSLILPAATNFPAGFSVWVKGQGATVTVSPAASGILLDGANTTLTLTTGQGVGIRSDNVNYYSSGQGVSH